MVGDKPRAEVWAVYDYCTAECDADGTSVVALFATKQTAEQFAEARGYPGVSRMVVFGAMKALD